MQKKAVRNFCYSFLFSLLVVGLISKAYFRAPETKINNQPKLPAPQTISLFSSPIINSDFKSEKADIDVSAIEALSTPSSIKADNLSGAENNQPHLSLNDTKADLNTAAKDKSTDNEISSAPKINTDLSASQEIILEKENVIKVADNLSNEPDYEQSGIVYSDISDTIADEKQQTAANETKLASVVYAPEGNVSDEKNLSAGTSDNKDSVTTLNQDNEQNKSVIQLASATNTVEYSDEIPLTETSDILHNRVEIAKSANASEIAMLEPANLVSNIENLDEPEDKTLAEADLKQNEWTQMSETKEDSSPWVIAKGNKFAKNRIAVEQFAEDKSTQATTETVQNEQNDADQEKISTALNPEKENKAGKETKLAYQMIPNLLIPIPEDIANDPNLTPQLSVSPEQNKKEEKEEQRLSSAEQNMPVEDLMEEGDKQSGLFKSITSWFSGDKNGAKDEQKTSSADEKQEKKSTFNFFGMGGSDTNTTPVKTQILPAELRLSFQPNRAEISGQTLRWIHAFADNARDNDDMYIEVRIDGTSSFALQKKRLNLLSTIFANRGVDFRKINIVFTSREPNSFIIRNIRFNNKEEVVVNQDSKNSYYRPW